jgi:hypothetical protein
MVVDSLLQVTIILMHHAYASTPLEMEISILDNNGSIQNPSRSSLSLSQNPSISLEKTEIDPEKLVNLLIGSQLTIDLSIKFDKLLGI